MSPEVIAHSIHPYLMTALGDINLTSVLIVYFNRECLLSILSVKDLMMNLIDDIKKKYPDAQAWSIGDNPDMANQLADLVIKGIKTASCGSLASFLTEAFPPKIGSYNIILNGQGIPVCIIRMIAMYLIRFSDVTEELARKEGEGDLSLEYWQKEHKAFFTREGSYSDDMELVAEEFKVIDVL